MRYVDRRTVAFFVIMALIGLAGLVLLLRPDDASPAAVADPEPPTSPATSEPTPTATTSPTPTPSATATATPTSTPEQAPTVDPTEAELAELRESSMWLGLAEWDRAGEGRADFYWFSERRACPFGEFSNAEVVWNQFASQLREEMLRMVVDEGVTPSARRFPGTPIEDGFTSGVLGWWTNSDAGTSGRGSMFSAQASYRTSTGEPRIRRWPVLIGHSVDPAISTSASLRAIGPRQDLAVSDVPDTYEGNNEQFNEHHLAWLFAQEPINPPTDPPMTCED